MENNQVYTTEQVMKLLGIGRQWVYHYRKFGVLTSFQIMKKGKHFWNKEQVDNLVKHKQAGK